MLVRLGLMLFLLSLPPSLVLGYAQGSAPLRLRRLPLSLGQLTAAASSPQTAQVREALSDAPAILAPLTRGGNLPFRVLCAELYRELGGPTAAHTPLPTVSEMVYARFLLKGDPTERARMRFNAELEQSYGVQIATNKIEEGVAASEGEGRGLAESCGGAKVGGGEGGCGGCGGGGTTFGCCSSS